MIKQKMRFPKLETVISEREFIQKFQDASIKAVGLATQIIHHEVVSNIPRGATGKAGRSITTDTIVRRGGQQVIGIVGSPEKVVLFLEEGTRPHWAPLAPLLYWAKRKTGNARFGKWVRLKIAGVLPMPGGTPAFKTFEKAFKATRGRALAIYRDAYRTLTRSL